MINGVQLLLRCALGPPARSELLRGVIVLLTCIAPRSSGCVGEDGAARRERSSGLTGTDVAGVLTPPQARVLELLPFAGAKGGL
jgi:hypothetical protein